MARLLVCVIALALLGGCASPRSMDVETTDNEAGRRGLFAEDSRPTPPPTNQDIRGRYEGLTEAPLERTELRIQRAGWIRVKGGVEMQDSKQLRRMAPQLEATVMAFNDYSVTFKMPSAKLELLLEVIENTKGWQIDEFDFSAWDRTGEYFSVEARMASAQAVKDRLMKLLEAAATLDEVLKIHGKLEDIQKQLDTFEGTLREVKLHAGRVDVVIRFD